MEELGDLPLSVDRDPVAWRIEVVEDDKYRGFEFVRLGPDTIRYNRVVH